MNEEYLRRAIVFFKNYLEIKENDWELFNLRALKEGVAILIDGDFFTKEELQRCAVCEYGFLIPNTFFD